MVDHNQEVAPSLSVGIQASAPENLGKGRRVLRTTQPSTATTSGEPQQNAPTTRSSLHGRPLRGIVVPGVPDQLARRSKNSPGATHKPVTHHANSEGWPRSRLADRWMRPTDGRAQLTGWTFCRVSPTCSAAPSRSQCISAPPPARSSAPTQPSARPVSPAQPAAPASSDVPAYSAPQLLPGTVQSCKKTGESTYEVAYNIILRGGAGWAAHNSPDRYLGHRGETRNLGCAEA